MTTDVEVYKQVTFALLSGPDGLHVNKQVGYSQLAYPKIDLSKQVGFAEMARKGPQVGKQVVYALLRTYAPLLASLDLLGEMQLAGVAEDPSIRVQVDFVGEGQLIPAGVRDPPFDCQPQGTTTWACGAALSAAWNAVTSPAAAWACADDTADTHNDALLDSAGDFLVTVNGERIRLI